MIISVHFTRTMRFDRMVVERFRDVALDRLALVEGLATFFPRMFLVLGLAWAGRVALSGATEHLT